MFPPILISLLVAGFLCWIATLVIPAGTPRNVAFVIIVLACVGGYIGFGGIAHACAPMLLRLAPLC